MLRVNSEFVKALVTAIQLFTKSYAGKWRLILARQKLTGSKEINDEISVARLKEVLMLARMLTEVPAQISSWILWSSLELRVDCMSL